MGEKTKRKNQEHNSKFGIIALTVLAVIVLSIASLRLFNQSTADEPLTEEFIMRTDCVSCVDDSMDATQTQISIESYATQTAEANSE